MGRELGKKSQAIIDALRESDYMMSADDLALAIGDTEEGGAMRVRALLKSMCGRGLVHLGARASWGAGPAPDAAAPLPEPADATPSQRLARAGFSARDARLTCDECGKKFTRQMLPIHKCEPEPAPPRIPVAHRQRFDLIAAIVRAADIEATVEPPRPGEPTRITLVLHS